MNGMKMGKKNINIGAIKMGYIIPFTTHTDHNHVKKLKRIKNLSLKHRDMPPILVHSGKKLLKHTARLPITTWTAIQLALLMISLLPKHGNRLRLFARNIKTHRNG